MPDEEPAPIRGEQLDLTALQFHPAAELFPMMRVESREFGELVSDIRERGLIRPIELHEGKILDGRNRYRACQHANVEPHFQQWEGESPTAYVLSVNLYRRHLTESQRAAISTDALPLLEEEAKRRQGTRTDLGHQLPGESARKSEHPSRDQAAELLQVTPYKVRQAKEIKEEAPDLHERVKTGEVTITDAHRQVAERAERAITEAATDSPDAQRKLVVAELRRRVAGVVQATTSLCAMRPEVVAEFMDSERVQNLTPYLDGLTRWLAAVQKERQDIHVIEGD